MPPTRTGERHRRNLRIPAGNDSLPRAQTSVPDTVCPDPRTLCVATCREAEFVPRDIWRSRVLSAVPAVRRWRNPSIEWDTMVDAAQGHVSKALVVESHFRAVGSSLPNKVEKVKANLRSYPRVNPCGWPAAVVLGTLRAQPWIAVLSRHGGRGSSARLDHSRVDMGSLGPLELGCSRGATMGGNDGWVERGAWSSLRFKFGDLRS